VTLIAVLYIIYAGFQIMTGAGDEEKNKKAKNIILYVVIGIVIMWLAYSIVDFIIKSIDKSASLSP
jgi:type IV secretory pathway VirB2 component (pilin)